MAKPISDAWIEGRLKYLADEIRALAREDSVDSRAERRTLLELKRVRAEIRDHRRFRGQPWVDQDANDGRLYRKILPECGDGA